ncbi:hypothetical protein VPNG_04373 [Cytospora leucostoma]|uniref:Uncharacterized protein n=1 Tax=Cytospora leucostoma TaxID=1230097 RepID=A0A423XC16_9PEZI|nr:hypothetical protein VPNG_04373 [Cytospora leucostoma]
MDNRNHPDRDRSSRSSEDKQDPAGGFGELEHVNNSPSSPAGPEGPVIDPNEVPDLGPLVAAINEEHNTGNDEAPQGHQDPEGHQSSDGDKGEQQSSRDSPCSSTGCEANRKRLLFLMRRRIAEKDRTIEAKDNEIERLNEERGRKNTSRSIVPTWPSMLRQYLAGNNITYEKVWKQSQRELNMPINPHTIHPNIHFIARHVDESLEDDSRQSSPADPATPLPHARAQEPCFPISELPGEIFMQVLEKLLWFDNSLVHCFSRLDPYRAPSSFPSARELGGHQTGVPHRFFISAEKRAHLSLTYDTVDPNEVLRPLLVCRKWAWYGMHIFYGRNTFAFSSLGEMERFCNGIKAARVQRVQNVELMWVGGKCLAFNNGRSKKRLNMRTVPLTWFCETSSLKTLVVHISEISKGYIRRPYEPDSIKNYMKGKTAGQPNARITRALRCCHGMDYIYQLRGLQWFRAYDVDKERASMERHPIRDISFVDDVERVVTMPKVPLRAAKSTLRRLERLLPAGGWEPSKLDFAVFKEAFGEGPDDETTTWNDLDRDTTSSRGTPSPDPSSEGSDDEDSDTGSDSSGPDSTGPGLPTPPASSSRRNHRGATPAPVRVEILDSDEGSEDENEDIENPHQEIEDKEDTEEQDSDQDIEDGQNPNEALSISTDVVDYRPRYHHPDTSNETAIVKWEPHTDGGIVKYNSDELRKQVISQATISDPITLDDDDDDVQEIPRPTYEFPRPAQRRSTTSGLFVTPHPSEMTPSSDRATVDLTGEPEMGPPLRHFSRGTTASSGLFVSQSRSETRETYTPTRHAQTSCIDLTHLPDDDEGNDSRNGPVRLKEEGVGDQRSVTTLSPTQQSYGSKRPRSSSMTAVTESSGSSYKRQRTDDRLVDGTQSC